MKHKTQFMNNLPLLNDLRVFMLVARRAGFASAAEELGVSPAFVSKRIALLEQTLNVLLLHHPAGHDYRRGRAHLRMGAAHFAGRRPDDG